MNAPQFTAQELKNFAAYVKVQRGGRFNMFDPRAREITRMSMDEWVFVMEHYEALEAASQTKE